MVGDKNTPEAQRVVTVASWVFLLHVAGVMSREESIREACQEMTSAGDAAAGDVAAMTLVDRLAGAIGDDLASGAQGLFEGQVHSDMGEGDRETRSRRIRSYGFERGLPWLARICRRQADGTVAGVWMVVERFGNTVTLMDPNPWDEVDETLSLPLADFHVLWELAGTPSVYLA
jgi:hypothetical protein